MNFNLNKNQLLQALAVGALAVIAGFVAAALAKRLVPVIPNTGISEVDHNKLMGLTNFLTGFLVFLGVSVYGWTCSLGQGM